MEETRYLIEGTDICTTMACTVCYYCRVVIILQFGTDGVDMDPAICIAKTCSAMPLLVASVRSVRFRYEKCDWLGLKYEY